VRNIFAAEFTYQTSNPNTGFTCNLSDLSALLDDSLASGKKDGYVFAVQNCTAEKDEGPEFEISGYRNSHGIQHDRRAGLLHR
jgi:hypothetical protein